MDLKSELLAKFPILEESQYDLVKQYIDNIETTKSTSNKLAIAYHMKKIKELIGDDQSNDSSSVSLEVETLLGFLDKDPYLLSKELAPHAQMRYNYLFLDTDNNYTRTDAGDKFTWLINDKIPIYQKGYINLHAPIKNIKMARLGRVSLTHMFNNDMTSISSGRRITFGFDEFTSQALVAPDSTRFQFVANLRPSDATIADNAVISTFDQNRGWFRFRERFRILDKLTLTLRDAFATIPRNILVPDIYVSFSGTQTSGLAVSGGGWAVLDPLIIPDGAKYMSNLIPEDVILSGYTTNDPVGDAAGIAAYNSQHRLFLGGDIYYFPPINPFGMIDNNPIWRTVTITLIYKPRLTCALELVSEDEPDEQ